MKTLRQDQSEFNVLFVHREIDDYGLSTNQFRLYAHLARRSGDDGAWPSVESMARHCHISPNTVRRCLHYLRQQNLIHARERSGFTTVYTLTKRSQWKPSPRQIHPYQSGGAPTVGEGTPTKRREGRATKRGETKVIQEGYPLKDNTVKGDGTPLVHVAPTPADPPRVPSPTPNGRGPDGLPAINGQRTQGDSCKTSQAPIHLKAYAIAERLQAHHWDNCKVTFAKESARSYAEQALLDGHLEMAIVSAYSAALRYCHGYATDEINNSKRHPYEKTDPALTIYLARKRLQCDGKTIGERWSTTVAHLQNQRREVARLSAKATAWFAQQHAAMTPPAESTINASATTTDPQQAPAPQHPAQGDVTAAERSEIGPATLASSGRSFSRHAVVAPRSPARDRLPPDTDKPCPVGPGHVPVPSLPHRSSTDTRNQPTSSPAPRKRRDALTTSPVRCRAATSCRQVSAGFNQPLSVSTPQLHPSNRASSAPNGTGQAVPIGV